MSVTKGTPSLPSGLDRQLRATIEKLAEASDTGAGLRGKPDDRYIRVRDLITLGLAKKLGNSAQALVSGKNLVSPLVPNLSTPPAPENVETSGSIGLVFVSWKNAYGVYANHALEEIWRSEDDDLGSAVLVGQSSTGFMYADYDVDYSKTYYYWVRFVSDTGIKGPYNSPMGTPGQCMQDPAEVLALLEGEIRETHLFADLNARIDRIDDPTNGLIKQSMDNASAILAEAQSRADGDVAQAQNLLSAELSLNTKIQTEKTQRENADEMLAQSVSSLAAGSGTQFDSAKIWYFDSALESWTGNGTPAPSVEDGWLRVGQAASAYITSPDNLALDGSAYRFAKLRIKKFGAPVWRGQLRWITADDATFNAAKQVVIPEPSFDANGVATIDFSDLPWSELTIRRLRFYFTVDQTAGAGLLVDWIALGRPTPGASVALVKTVEDARIAGDAAEAAARNTLATQMRGSYAGSDINQVATGLIYAERVARTAADTVNANALSSEVTARETLQAAVEHGTTGLSATRARLITEEGARATADTALGNRITVVEARMPAGGGQLATSASVSSVDSASVSRDSALSQAITGTNAALADKASSSALNAIGSRVTTAENTITSQGNSLVAVKASLLNSPAIPGDFVNGLDDWTLGRHGAPTAAATVIGGTLVTDTDLGRAVELNFSAAGQNIMTKGVVRVVPGRIYEVRVRFKVTASDGSVGFNIVAALMPGDFSSSLSPGFVAASYTTVSTVDSVVEISAKFSTLPVGDALITAGTTYFRYGLRLATTESGLVFRVGSIACVDVTDVLALANSKADSSAVESLSAAVNHSSTGLVATANKVTALQTALGGADAGAFSTLKSQVEHGATGLAATADKVDQVSAQLPGSGNLIPTDTDFILDTAGWVQHSNTAGPNPFVIWSGPDSADTPLGIGRLRLGISGTATTAIGTYMTASLRGIAVEENKRYCFSVYLATARTTARVHIIWYNAAGTGLAEPISNAVTGVNTENLSGWTLASVFATAPAGAVKADLRVRGTLTALNDPRVFFCRPMFSQVEASVTVPPKYSPSGATKTVAAVQVTAEAAASIADGAVARWEVKATVGQLTGGVGFWNDGTKTRFAIHADQFYVYSPGASSFGLIVEGGKVVMDGAAIKNLSVTTAAIANLSVNSAKLANLSVIEAKIANAAITNAKIVDGAITNAKIANAAITNAKIADAAIDSAKIANIIQSTNYNPGIAGWRINKTGDAEFNGVVVTRPNVVASGTLIPTTGMLQAGSHFIGSGVSFPGVAKARVGGSLGFVEFSGGYCLSEDRRIFIVDVPTSSFSPEEVGVINGKMLFAQAVVDASTVWHTGGAPPPFSTPCSVEVARVSNYGTAGSYIRLYISVLAPTGVAANITAISITQIRWALSFFT